MRTATTGDGLAVLSNLAASSALALTAILKTPDPGILTLMKSSTDGE